MIVPWNILRSGLIYHAFYIVWFYGALLLGLALAALAVRFRLRASHLTLLFTFLLLYCTNSLLEALPRYLSVLFPFYIVTPNFACDIRAGSAGCRPPAEFSPRSRSCFSSTAIGSPDASVEYLSETGPIMPGEAMFNARDPSRIGA